MRLANYVLLITLASAVSLAGSVNVMDILDTLNKYDVVVSDETTTTTTTTAESGALSPNNSTEAYSERKENKVKEKVQNIKSNGNEDESHPCRRPCTLGKFMICKYEFVIEHFSVMSRSCLNCPHNITHCRAKNCIAADGVKRTILVVNRQMPGPSIEVCHGDTIEVKVTNKMLDTSTTIHWHGLLQKETPFMDGVPFVSQCPIEPQTSFLYEFHADTPGTHIWHAHSAFQRGDGLYGPIVVKVPPSQNPHVNFYDYDLSEHVLTTMDWEHTFSVDKFTLHMHAEGDNKPPSLLVNGKGRFRNFGDEAHKIFTPVEKFTVAPDSRYRFRFINAGFLNCPIEMSIDNHTLTVIASDGEDIRPTETESLVSLAGERFDFVVESNQEVDNYWIRFKGLLDCDPKEAFQVAVLHYLGADEEADPDGVVTYKNAGREGLQVNSVNTPADAENSILISDLRSAEDTKEDPILRPEPDFKFYISFDFYDIDNPHYGYSRREHFFGQQRITTPQLNHISMKFPPFALMTDIERSKTLNFCNGSSISLECLYKFCECAHVLQVPLNAVVEIILIDEGKPYDANHPFHLHGHKFRVLGMDRLGKSTTEGEVRRLDDEGLLKRNFKNPPVKDTISTPDGGYTILRFHATNPGFWIFHCHIDFHMEMGMAVLFKIGDDASYKPPPKNFPKCGDYGRSNDTNAFTIDRPTEKITDDREFYSVHSSSSGYPAYSSHFYLLPVLLIIMSNTKTSIK